MPALQERAVEKHQKGIRLYQSGQIDQALLWLGEALSQEETSERWNDWASVQLAAGHTEDAEAGFRKALKLHVQNHQACANLGALLAGQGRFQEAVRLLEQSLPGMDEEGKVSVAKLVERCRTGLTPSAQPDSPNVDQVLARISKTLTLQTSALNAVTMRLLSIEAGIERILQSLKPAAVEVTVSEGILPRIKASDLIPEPTDVVVLAPESAVESISVCDLRLLIDLVRVTKPRSIFQFGTADGRTTLNLAANSPAGSHVYTLDVARDRLGDRFKGTEFEGRITQLTGDSRKFDYSPYLGSTDFVFLSANREYDHAWSDSQNAMKLLQDGKGTIVWHGYAPPSKELMEALDRLFQTEPKLGGMRHIEGTGLVYAWVV